MSGPWTNQVVSTVIVGQAGSNQIILGEVGSRAELQFLIPVAGLTAEAPANIAAEVATNAGSPAFALVISGPQNNPSNANDWAQIVLYSDNEATGASAAGVFNFISDTGNGGGVYPVATWGPNGFVIQAGSMTSLEPGSGQTGTFTPTPETWHKATLLNSWVASGGVAGLYYRFVGIGDGLIEIIGDIINTTATGNSICFTLPTGYHPSISSNHPAGVNNGGSARATPWIFVDTSGDIQVTGIVTANLETFFHIFIPADLTA